MATLNSNALAWGQKALPTFQQTMVPNGGQVLFCILLIFINLKLLE